MSEATEYHDAAAAVAALLTLDDNDPHAIPDQYRNVLELDEFTNLIIIGALVGMTRDLLGWMWDNPDDPERLEYVATRVQAIIEHQEYP